jgi:hypothetical protein
MIPAVLGLSLELVNEIPTLDNKIKDSTESYGFAHQHFNGLTLEDIFSASL